jgi:hypothetical protein
MGWPARGLGAAAAPAAAGAGGGGGGSARAGVRPRARAEAPINRARSCDRGSHNGNRIVLGDDGRAPLFNMATASLFSRPLHLIAVLWFLIHIPTTLLVDIQSSARAGGSDRGPRSGAPRSAAQRSAAQRSAAQRSAARAARPRCAAAAARPRRGPTRAPPPAPSFPPQSCRSTWPPTSRNGRRICCSGTSK